MSDAIVAKIGINNVDGQGLGYNIEFGYEIQTKKIPSFSLAATIGFAAQDDFPDVFKPYFNLSENASVSVEVDEFIRTRTPFSIGYLRQQIFYAQTLLYYRPPVSLFKCHIDILLGIDVSQRFITSFGLSRFRIQNSLIVDHTPKYEIADFLLFDYVMGTRVRRPLTPSLSLSVEGKLQVPIGGAELVFVNGYLQIGIIKKI